MTKGQLHEMIQHTMDRVSGCASEVLKQALTLKDNNAMVLAEAVIVTGVSISEALASLALVLCETLPGASGGLVETPDGSFVEGLRKAMANDEKED